MLILIGKSASGKTEVAKNLKSFGIQKIITYTTRKPRENEINGIDYFFLSKADFLNKINNHFFFESEIYNNEYYGTALKDIKNDTVLIVEPNGLTSFSNSNLNIFSIYIDVDYNTRKTRMINRNDDPSKIQSRLINDESTFNDAELLTDYTLKYSGETIIELTNKIFNIYTNNIKKGVNNR